MKKSSKRPDENRKKTVTQVLSHLGRYRFALAFSVLLAVVTVILTLYIPKRVGDAIDSIAVTEKLTVNFDTLLPILFSIGAAALGVGLAQWIQNAVNNRITTQIVRDIRKKAFDRLQILPLSYLDAHPAGEIVSRIMTDTDTFSEGLFMGFTQFFTGIATILGTIGFMLAIHPGITLVVLLITPLSLFVASFIARHTHDMFKKQSEARGEQTAFIDEMIGEQKTVQAFGHEAAAQAEFDEVNERLRACSLRAIFYSSITNPATRFVNNAVYAGVALTGALAVLSGGSLTVGGLTCLLSYANQYTKPFNEISGVIAELQNALTCAARVFALIDAVPEPQDAEGAKLLSDVQGAVALDHVDFSYVPDRPLIENFNLRVNPGERIAIVGPTGCGKTTLINLLMRFYDVNGGSVSVDETDIRHITRDSLRAGWGMVLQETWLRSGTIRENLVMGKPDATDEEVYAAAAASHADSFIRRLPMGYETVIGEGGDGLSQGQRQLLCITRVMLCLPPMLILDEATSSIDTRTELQIQNAFAEMMKGRTSFIVAHRLSTVKDADKILVMRDGHIIETGTHETLLSRGGFYAELYQSQFAQ